MKEELIQRFRDIIRELENFDKVFQHRCKWFICTVLKI